MKTKLPTKLGPLLAGIRKGDVVLVNKTMQVWAGTLAIVEEERSWGVIASVPAPNEHHYPLRIRFDEIEAVFKRVTTTH